MERRNIMIYLKPTIVNEPILKVTRNLSPSKDNPAFLVGQIGAGKTTVLNYYKDNLRENVVDITLENEDVISSYNHKLLKLYHISLVIKKLLLYVSLNFPLAYRRNFLFLDAEINHLLKLCRSHFQVGSYENIHKDDLSFVNDNTAEELINKFIRLAIKSFDYQTLTLIIDNFDMPVPGAKSYQKIIYYTLKKYFPLILSISDQELLNNSSLNKNNEIVTIDYNFDIPTLYEILNRYLIKNLLLPLSALNERGLNHLINADVMEYMIKKTNGNIKKMELAVNILYKHLDSISNPNSSLLKIIDEEIVPDNDIPFAKHKPRVLYIK